MTHEVVEKALKAGNTFHYEANVCTHNLYHLFDEIESVEEDICSGIHESILELNGKKMGIFDSMTGIVISNLLLIAVVQGMLRDAQVTQKN